MANVEQVREGAVPADIAGLFLDIRHALRTSYVPLPFRVLGIHHAAVRAAWRQLRPNVVTRAFEEAADDLRARLATAAFELGTPLIETVLLSIGLDVDDVDTIRDQVDLFHYTDAKTLLCVASLDEAVKHGRVGGKHLAERLLLPLPEGTPPDAPRLHPTKEEPGGILGEVFHEIMATTHLPVATLDLRALGHWPTFVEAAWDELGHVFQHRDLQANLQRIDDTATLWARSQPFAIDLTKDLFAEHPESAAFIGNMCRLLREPMTRLALFATALKVGFDGPQEARDSPYPVEWDETSADRLDLH